MDKKEIIAALWLLDNKINLFIQKIEALKGSSLCKCRADTEKVVMWLAQLYSRAKAISTDRELIEAYRDSPDMNAILYRESKKQTEALMARVIKEAATLMGCDLNG